MYTSYTCYTQSPPVDYACTCGPVPLRNICHFMLFPRFETQRKQRYKQLFIIIQQRTMKNHFQHFLVIKTQKITLLKFYKSHIHEYNWLLLMLHRKTLQEGKTASFSHLNTNSRLQNFGKNKNANSRMRYKIHYYWLKILILNCGAIFGKYHLKHCIRLNHKSIF